MKIWIDGAGALIEGQRWKAVVVFEDGSYDKSEGPAIVTNNEAEYKALIHALLDERAKDSTIYTDSQLLVGQLTKGWKIKAENLKGYVENAKPLLIIANAKLVWIPREQNKAGKLIEQNKN